MIGNTIAARIPIFKSPPIRSATIPTTVGPDEHPKSPASAISAYMAVPPPGSSSAAILNVPGQNIPTVKPQKAHPKSPKNGLPTNTAIK